MDRVHLTKEAVNYCNVQNATPAFHRFGILMHFINLSTQTLTLFLSLVKIYLG